MQHHGCFVFILGSIPSFRGKTGKHHRPGTDTVTLPHFVHGDLLPCCQSFNLKVRLIRIFDGWQYQIFYFNTACLTLQQFPYSIDMIHIHVT